LSKDGTDTGIALDCDTGIYNISTGFNALLYYKYSLIVNVCYDNKSDFH